MLRSALCMLLAVSAALADGIPPGWKAVKDHKQMCQIAVPSDWTIDPILTSQATAPDKKAKAIVHAVTRRNFADAINAAKQMMKPEETFEDTDSHAWWSFKSNGERGVSHWYFIIDGDPVCNAQIDFDSGADEATTKKIVGTLSQVK